MEPCRTQALITIFFNFSCSHSCLKIRNFFFRQKNVTFLITNCLPPIVIHVLLYLFSSTNKLFFWELLLMAMPLVGTVFHPFKHFLME